VSVRRMQRWTCRIGCRVRFMQLAPRQYRCHWIDVISRALLVMNDGCCPRGSTVASRVMDVSGHEPIANRHLLSGLFFRLRNEEVNAGCAAIEGSVVIGQKAAPFLEDR
jgi:hypothetical protein